MQLSFRAVSYLAAACAVGGLTVVAACSDSSSGVTSTSSTSSSGGSPEASAGDAGIPDTGADSGPDPLAGCTKDPGGTPATFDPNSKSDPTGGAANFTLAAALAGFPSGSGTLTAAITTEDGFIKCTLDEAAAPITVANFVGLARGTRPYILTSQWQVSHFYDGLTFHRVIPDFVIQGGDPDGDGTGGPGYDLVTENQVAEPLGTLAMAASNTVSGSQFYIVVGTGPMPEYNVFGSCTTDNAITIANVPADTNDKPLTPVHMLKVEIGRCP